MNRETLEAYAAGLIAKGWTPTRDDLNEFAQSDVESPHDAFEIGQLDAIAKAARWVLESNLAKLGYVRIPGEAKAKNGKGGNLVLARKESGLREKAEKLGLNKKAEPEKPTAQLRTDDKPKEMTDTVAEPVSPASQLRTEASVDSLPPGVSKDDIPYKLAYSAHAYSSFSPDIRAKSTVDDYLRTMSSDWASLSEFAKEKGADVATLASEWDRYREGYKSRYRDLLSAESRTASAMVTGRSNFPVRQQNKRRDVANKRLSELVEYRKSALSAIFRKLTPDTEKPIQSSNESAVSLLQQKLQEAEQKQDMMKRVNAAHKRYVKDPGSIDNADLSDSEKSMIRNYKPQYSWEPHPFAPFELTNNNANIKRIKDRIASVSSMKASDPSVTTYTGGVTVHEDPDAARIRIKFPQKPHQDAIDKLKSRGFRWSPSENAWQRHLNNGGRYAVTSVLEQLGHKPEATT